MSRVSIHAVARRILPRALLNGLRRWYYPRKIRRMSPSDWPPAVAVRSLLSPGDVAADVGANIGYVTCWLSQWVGPGGRVYSFEPVPQTFALLAHNAAKLGLSNVRLFRAAASDREGTVSLNIPEWAGGGANLYEARIVEAGEALGAELVEAPTLSLDRVFALHRDEPAVVKIDVEGHEERVLRGACRLLAETKPAVVIEISAKTAPAVFATMTALGYSCFVPNGATCRAQSAACALADALFLQPYHIVRLREKGVEIRY
jgi:FkbM family methyltransferase